MASKGRNLAKLIVDASGRQEDQVFTGDYIKVPVGTTEERPSGPSAGYVRFNTTTATLEQYTGASNGGWTSMAKPPIISTVSYSGGASAIADSAGEVITISGTNFTTGVNVLFGTTYATSVTRTNSTSLSVTVPALSAADYDVTVINNDGMQAILTDGLSVNGTPAFSTASGTLGSIQVDQAITKITIVAAEDDSGDISYTVTTGSLPTGLSIDSSGDSAGTISGTPTGYTSESTVNFTITATDDENQTTTRDFSLTVLVNFYSYELTNSAFFAGSQNISTTPTTAGNRKTFTISFWFKRGQPNNNFVFFYTTAEATERDALYFDNVYSEQLQFYTTANSFGDVVFKTSRVFRDYSAWYHVVLAVDTTQATAADRFKLYINGELNTDYTVDNRASIAQNTDMGTNSVVEHTIGENAQNSSWRWVGYIADFHLVDGTALSASSFGESKQNVWIPKQASGINYGTNGFHLDFSNTSDLSEDQSGNNISLTDNLSSVLDTPTNNFAVLEQESQSPHMYLGYANLRAIGNYSTDAGHVLFSMLPSSGKWYIEYAAFRNGNNYPMFVNYADSSYSVKNHQGSGWNGTREASSFGLSTSGTDIIGVAVDYDNNLAKFYVNGSYYSGQDLTLNNPSTGGGIGISSYNSSYAHINAGQDSSFFGLYTAQGNTDENGVGDFYYTPPTGYLALCNANLPENATFELHNGEKPSDHFKAIAYTGTDTDNRAITGLGFQPDLVISKRTNTATNWGIYDSIRGPNKRLSSNLEGGEASDDNALMSFDSDGYTVSSDGTTNAAGNYVAYAWKAGGTAVSNTDGSITSSVSANTSAGFSIVSYHGANVSNSSSTVGHGLSQAPELVIYKNRETSSNWNVYAKPIGETNNLWLNSTDGTNNYGWAYFDDTAPTSSVLTIYAESSGMHQMNGDYDYIAYCWHSVPGFSKVGSYIGNNSTDGTFINTGFRPAFVMLKNLSRNENWRVMDAARSPYNQVSVNILPNRDYAQESGFANQDFLSNGFKLRTNDWGYNYTDSYVYIAFAEDPFKYGNAR